MLELDADPPFVGSLTALYDLDGAQGILLVLKGTYSLDPQPVLLEEQEPVLPADQYCADPTASSLRYPGEVHLPQPGSVVGLVGQAWVPEGRRRACIDVLVQVGDLRKQIRVFGNRRWQGGSPSDPEPFSSMPLIHENAFGGSHHFHPEMPPGPDSLVVFEANPVGKGFVGKRRGERLQGLELPNLEDPSRPINSLRDQPPPASPGYVAPHWAPRRRFAGTYDSAWQQQRAPLWPRDFDPRFFQAGVPALTMEQSFLQGGEPIRLQNVHPSRPRIDSRVPADQPSARAWLKGAARPLPLRLESLRLEPDLDRMVLVWRGFLRCERQVLKVSRVEVRCARSAPQTAVGACQ